MRARNRRLVGAVALSALSALFALFATAAAARAASPACEALVQRLAAQRERCRRENAAALVAQAPACAADVAAGTDLAVPGVLVQLAQAGGCADRDPTNRAEALEALCTLRSPYHRADARAALTQTGPAPAVHRSVAACVRALLADRTPEQAGVAGARLDRAAAQHTPDEVSIFTRVRSLLRDRPELGPPVVPLLRQHASLYQALCLPRPPSGQRELADACAEASLWYRTGTACPAIGAFLARPDVRAGRCDAAPDPREVPDEGCRAAARADRAVEVPLLAAILQTPLGQSPACRARGLDLLCALRPEAALPVLSAWRKEPVDKDAEAAARCLLALPTAAGDTRVRDYLFPGPPFQGLGWEPPPSRDAVLVEMLRQREPPDRAALAPLVRLLDRESKHRAAAVALLCADAATAKQQGLCPDDAATDGARSGGTGRRYTRTVDGPLAAALATTAGSLALAGLHVGLSARYAGSTDRLGAASAYQGALGGAFLTFGIGAIILDTQNAGHPVTFLTLGTLSALVGGIAGGVAGYRLGDEPGSGRIVTSVVAQSFILATTLGITWRLYRGK